MLRGRWVRNQSGDEFKGSESEMSFVEIAEINQGCAMKSRARRKSNLK